MAQNQIPYSPNPTVEPSSGGSGATYADVPAANANAFGAQIGQAEEKLGATSEDLGKMYLQRANEASANDKIVNQWAPSVTQLSQNYYSKQGKDAVAGFQPYMEGLQNARTDLLKNATPAEATILNQYMSRHIAQEYDGAMRHQVQQMDVYENQTSDAFVNLQATNAVSAGSNPDMIDGAIKAGMGRIQMHGLDRGQSPDVIQQQQNTFEGNTAKAVVSSAITRGDLSFANSFYNSHKDNIAGVDQVEIDKALHSENMRTFGNSAADAIISGSVIPHPATGGADTTSVKSTVAGAAQSAGVDPNASLMIAGIESSFGQNVGARGDIGQTGKPAANLGEQAQNLVTAQKQAQDAADKAVGGTAAPWQMYTVYQQGLGGGVALLKPENASAKAVDVLSPFYPNPKDALAAIQKNGGNSTMTTAQFTDMLKQKCETIYGQVQCDTTKLNGQPVDLSKAITDPHQTGGVTLQPTASPVQALQAFDAQYPQMLQRAQEIPNLDQRSAVLEALEKKHGIYQAGANAYTATLVNKAAQLAVDPKFVSMDQVPNELSVALAADHPQTLTYMENRAKANLEKQSGANSEEIKKYGQGFNDVLHNVWNGSVTNIAQLHSAQADGKISLAGVDRLTKELDDGGDPLKHASELKMQAAAFNAVQLSLTHGMKDNPAAAEQWANALPSLYAAIDERKSRVPPVPFGQYYDPKNKEFIGNSVQAFTMNKSAALQAQIEAGKASGKIRPAAAIAADALAYKNDPVKLQALKQEAISGGYYDPNAPVVPMAGQ